METTITCTLSQSDIEIKNQQIYDLKRQLELARTLERDYQQEIESLQAEHKLENKKLEAAIISSEENIKSLTLSHEDQIRLLINDIADKDVQISRLERDMTLISKVQHNCNHEEFEKSISELKNQNVELMEYILEVETKAENGEKQRLEMEEMLTVSLFIYIYRCFILVFNLIAHS